MTATFDLDGHGYILIPRLILFVCTSKSTPYDPQFARYQDLSTCATVTLTYDLESQGSILCSIVDYVVHMLKSRLVFLR